MSTEPAPFPGPEEANAPPVVRDPFWGWRDVLLFFGLAISCLLTSEALGALAARWRHISPENPAVLVSAQAVGYLALFALLAAMLRMEYGAPFWRSLGWVRSRMPSLQALSVGVFLAFAIALVGGLLRLPDEDTLMKKLLQAPHGAPLLAGFGILIAPLAEELAFRGFLQPLAVRTMGTAAGILFTAATFGALHLPENAGSLPRAALITIAGAGFGWLRHVSGSTRTSVLAHAAYNSTLFLAFFAVGRNGKV